MQYRGTVNPHDFETGVREQQHYATFGKPDGYNASYPDQYTRSHSVPFHQTRQGQFNSFIYAHYQQDPDIT